jgi:hypothetical protein
MPTFPGTVSPAFWFDGNQPAYSDSAGLIPVTSGLVRRVNEAAPLTGAWTAESDPNRPTKDTAALRCELNTGDGGAAMVRAGLPSGLNIQSFTLVVSWVHRGMTLGGPQVGLLADNTACGLALGGDTVWVIRPAGIYTTGLVVAQGKRNTLFVTYSATGFEVVLNAGGVVTTASSVEAISSRALTLPWYLGHFGTGGFLYGSFVQAMGVARTIAAGTERDDLIAWAHAQPADPGYGTDRPLVGAIGDSLTSGTGSLAGSIYVYRAQQAARLIGNLAEVANTALGGSGIGNILSPGSILMKADAFYDSARAKNIAVLWLGSNEVNAAHSVDFICNGVGAPGGNGLYQGADYLRSRGWLVVGITILPRSDSPSYALVEASRLALNADLLTNGRGHFNRMIDTSGLVIGRPGDSDNTAYYSSDKIHLNSAGQGVLATAVTPVLLELLTAPDAPPAPVPPTASSRLWPSVRISGDRRGVLI